jgi:hypothetical protein
MPVSAICRNVLIHEDCKMSQDFSYSELVEMSDSGWEINTSGTSKIMGKRKYQCSKCTYKVELSYLETLDYFRETMKLMVSSIDLVKEKYGK